MNKIGIYFAFWTNDWSADFEYYLSKASKLGFDILEISTAYLLDTPKEKLRAIKSIADEKGIELTYCIGFPKSKDMASEDASTRKCGIEYAKKTLEVINLMGGKIFGGINYSYWPGTLNEGITDKRPHLDRCIGSMREVIKTAEDYGITYCVEIVNRFEQYLMNTAKEGVEFASAVGSPNIKLLLDTFHMNIEEDSFEDAIVIAADKLGHFHIGETNRKAPGKGRMPWEEIAGALKKTNYTGRIVMEPFVKMGGEVGRDIKVWRNLSDNTDETGLDAEAKEALAFIRGKMN